MFLKRLRKWNIEEILYLQYVIGAAGLIRLPTRDIVYITVNLTYECQMHERQGERIADLPQDIWAFLPPFHRVALEDVPRIGAGLST